MPALFHGKKFVMVKTEGISSDGSLCSQKVGCERDEENEPLERKKTNCHCCLHSGQSRDDCSLFHNSFLNYMQYNATP